MTKALIKILPLLLCVLFSFDTSDACPNGFVNESDVESLLEESVDGDAYHRDQLLFPDINFIGCNGSITAWTIGAQWDASNGQFPYLQIWRPTGVVTYVLIHNIELNVSGGGERPMGRYVFNGTVDPPLRFQDGDALGVFQPHRGRSRVRLNNLHGVTYPFSYHVLTDSDVIEPPLSTFTTNDAAVTTENSQPIVAIEITVDYCDPLQDPVNGTVKTMMGNALGSVSQYCCNEGFNLMGEETRVCQASGSWSGQEPVCQVVETQEPSSEQNVTGLAAGIASGVVGGALLLIISAVVIALLLRKRKVNQKYDISATEEHAFRNPLYTTNVGDDSVDEGKYSEVIGLKDIAPVGEKNDVPHTGSELSESVEATYIDNPVYADIGPIELCQNDVYRSVEARQKDFERGIHVPTVEQRRIFSEMKSGSNDPYSVYASLSGPGHGTQMASLSVFFDEEDIYWLPASNPNELYAQLAKHKYREILRHQIRTTEQLGCGRFGAVEKGVWQSPGGPVEVAVKTLKEGANEQDRVKFLQEAAITGQFHHPNVIKLHGVVTVGASTMVVLEFMSKGDLRTFLKEERPRPGNGCPPDMPKLCLEFCRQITAGMEYLAGKAFVHRDLSAESVLVSQRKMCKITDFRMAQDLEDDSSYSHDQGAGRIVVKWTAPEVLNFKRFSTASDVWSFGAVMYEVWSLGHKPFEGYSNQQTLRVVNEGFRLPPPPGCPKAIYSIMIKCWHPEASSRPTFANLKRILSDTNNLLSWSEEDAKVYPQAAVMGAPLNAGKDLYPELQGTYMY